MVISGRSEFDIPQNCIHCGDQMQFGADGIFWQTHTGYDFVICDFCAPKVIPALVKDLENLGGLQNLEQRHADYLKQAADEAAYYRKIINDNA